MDKAKVSVAQQIAQAALVFEQQRTGHRPRSVRVVLSGDVLVIVLHGALSEAEKNLAKNPDGAARLHEFHRQLFASAAATLHQEIERISGVKVREAAAEIEPSIGTALKTFTSGTVVQVFVLADSVETDAWSNDVRMG